MKRRFIMVLTLILAFAVAGPLLAGPSKDHRTGLGVGTGVGNIIKYDFFMTGKHWLKTAGRAVDFSVNFNEDFIGGRFNYLWHKFYIFKGDLGKKLPLYYGGGAAAYFAEDVALGGQAKAGFNYFFEAPFDAFVEFSPTIFLTPDVDIDFGGAVGARYYF